MEGIIETSIYGGMKMNENNGKEKSSLLCALVSMIVVSVAVGTILHRKGILKFECKEGSCRNMKCCSGEDEECCSEDSECCDESCC